MKLSCILILLFTMLLSCNSNPKIEGAWIASYSFSDTKKESYGFPIRNFIKFDDNYNFLFRDFKYDYNSEENLKKGIYKYQFDKLTYRVDGKFHQAKVDFYGDSLAFIADNGASNIMYKKLHDSLKSRKIIKLKNKSFELKSKNHKDTIRFINDSILIYESTKNKMKWEKINFDKYSILFIENDIPYILIPKTNNILMLGIHKKTYKIDLEEI